MILTIECWLFAVKQEKWWWVGNFYLQNSLIHLSEFIKCFFSHNHLFLSRYLFISSPPLTHKSVIRFAQHFTQAAVEWTSEAKRRSEFCVCNKWKWWKSLINMLTALECEFICSKIAIRIHTQGRQEEANWVMLRALSEERRAFHTILLHYVLHTWKKSKTYFFMLILIQISLCKCSGELEYTWDLCNPWRWFFALRGEFLELLLT